MRSRTFAWLALLPLICGACGLRQTPAPVPTPLFLTATLAPSATPTTPPTSAPPTPLPTLAPIEGTTTTQVNVRSEPSTGSSTVGMLDPFIQVQVTAKDAGGNWYQVLYPAAPDGKGWVRAQYVQVADPAQVPPLSGAPGAGGVSGVVTQQVNVRSGPGTNFNSLGTLNPQDSVALTGRNVDGSWLQIAFRAGPEGAGWIAAGFIQSSGIEALPIIGGQGEVIGTGTPGVTPIPPTPTVMAAKDDGDSDENPAVNIVFSPSGAGSLQFSSEVSSPEGDTEDWVQFTPYLRAVFIRLVCTGNGNASAVFWSAGNPAAGLPEVKCGEEKQVQVNPGTDYVLRVRSTDSAELQSTRYTLSISTLR